MQHQDNARRRIEGLALHLHPAREVAGDGNALIGILDHLAIERHQSGPDELLHLPAGAVTEIGEQPVEAQGRCLAHFSAS